MEYPRVLIVNEQSIEKNNATGITLRSLWAGWPTDCVMEIHVDPQEYKESILGIPSITPGANPLRKLSQNKALSKANQNMKSSPSTSSNRADSKAYTKTKMRQLFVAIVDSYPVRLSNEQRKVVDNFAPQIIYTLGASVNTMRLVNTLSKRYDIPVVIHYMDNWPEHIQWESNDLLNWYKSLLQKWHRNTLKRSKDSIVISPSMKSAYESKFGKPCFVLMNAVDIEALSCTKRSDVDAIKHVVYAGGLHLNRWQALKDIAGAIEKSDINGVLDIYTGEAGHIYKSNFEGLPVVFHKAVSHDEIKTVYENADVLVHAEVNNDILLGYFVYSISTKIPEYLATGKPVLFYGPKEMGLYEYLRDNDVAFVASTKEELFSAFGDMDNQFVLQQKIDNARMLVVRNHSSVNSRGTLVNVLDKSALKM